MAPEDELTASVETFASSEDGVLEIVTEQSLWLFDTIRRRFQCWPHGGAARPRAQLGAWRAFESLEIDTGGVLVVRPTDDPAIRVYLNIDPE